MDYQTFVSTELVPRILAALNGMKNSLVAAGVVAGNILVHEVTTEGVNDLRYRLEAKKGNKTFQVYIELTASGMINNQMALILTLWADGNGSQITTSYFPNTPVAYNDTAGIDVLIGKLGNFEATAQGELTTSARAFLGV